MQCVRWRTHTPTNARHPVGMLCAQAASRSRSPSAWAPARLRRAKALARLELQVFIAELFSRFRVSLAPIGMGSPEDLPRDAVLRGAAAHGAATEPAPPPVRIPPRSFCC
jgi:hypothetical protein